MYSRLKPPASSRGTHAFELGIDYGYFFKVSIYHAGERSEPEKFDNTEIKTGIGPPIPPPNPHTGPHLWQISGGGGSKPPVPPLDPRMGWGHEKPYAVEIESGDKVVEYGWLSYSELII